MALLLSGSNINTLTQCPGKEPPVISVSVGCCLPKTPKLSNEIQRSQQYRNPTNCNNTCDHELTKCIRFWTFLLFVKHLDGLTKYGPPANSTLALKARRVSSLSASNLPVRCLATCNIRCSTRIEVPRAFLWD